MQFSKEQNLTFEQAVEKMFEKLGDSKIMALASAVGTHVMVRNVSCLFYNNKIYFKTDKNFRKTQQLFENPNVALCWSGVQVEGVAEHVLGLLRVGRLDHGQARCAGIMPVILLILGRVHTWVVCGDNDETAADPARNG